MNRAMDSQEPEAGLSPEHERRLEQLLREDAAREPYIEDAGFTARVMDRLPPAQRSYSWLGPALGGLGAAVVAAFSSLPADLLAQVRIALQGHLPAPQSLLVLVPMAVLVGFAAWLAATESG
ncbi:MAG: hypothetical protein ISP90_10035 [Nevskia sp.]|nr:hypothetical protein [Nevskia sp.]